MSWTYVINDLEEIVATFYKKESQERSQKEFRLKLHYMLNGKVIIILLTAALIKKT